MTQVLDTKFSPVDIEARKKLDLRAGDTVRVWQKIKEGDKTRSQAFEGLVLARKHGTEAGATFTVRKVSDGIGIERIFPLYSPVIEKIEILRRGGRVRRSKLYYIREKVAREARRQLRRTRMMGVAPTIEETTSASEETAPVEPVAVGKKEKAG